MSNSACAVPGDEHHDSTDISDSEFQSDGARTDESSDNEAYYTSLVEEGSHEAAPDAFWRAERRRLIDCGLKGSVAEQVVKLMEKGTLCADDVDAAVVNALKEVSSETSLRVLRGLEDTSFTREENKSVYLCNLVAANTESRAANLTNNNNHHHRRVESGFPQRRAAGASNGNYNHAFGMVVLPPERVVDDMSITRTNGRGPDLDTMQRIYAKTPFTLAVSVGQRKYTVVDKTPPPPEGNEVFLCKIPRDVYEDELIPLLQSCGEVYQLRFMLDPLSGFARGYGFCKFKTHTGAEKAVRKLDEFEMRPGRKLGASVSFNNQRLFVSNIPKNKDKEELHEEFAKHAPGLVEVIIYSSPDDRKKNRGFCFLEYENHRAATVAKRKLGSGRLRVWNCDIIVDWADPLEEPDEETMSKVKVLYVRNLTQKVLEEDLKNTFQAYGVVERVKKIKDYAFVHFTEREGASKALAELGGVELGGAPMEVTWAKPPSDKHKKEEILRKREMRMTHFMYNRGRFWNSSVFGNSGYRGYRAVDYEPGMGRSGINSTLDFSMQQRLPPPRGFLNYAAATAAASAAAGGRHGTPAPRAPADLYGLGVPPLPGPGARQRHQLAYAQLLNAADFWDDFNDLDMSCSPLAPAAVPIPASAAATMAQHGPRGQGLRNHGGLLPSSPPPPHPPQQYGEYAQYRHEFEYTHSGDPTRPPPPLMGPMPGMPMPGGAPHFLNHPGQFPGAPPLGMGGQVPMGMRMAQPGNPHPPFFRSMDLNSGVSDPNHQRNMQGMNNNNGNNVGGRSGVFHGGNQVNQRHRRGDDRQGQMPPGQAPFYYQ